MRWNGTSRRTGRSGPRPISMARGAFIAARSWPGARRVSTMRSTPSSGVLHGIATPSLEARAAARMSFRHDVARVRCLAWDAPAGERPLARRAPGQGRSRIAGADGVPGALHPGFRLDELSSANVVATALFGDGAAAAWSRRRRRVGALAAAASTPGPTPGDHGWRVDPHGFGVIFDRSIPSSSSPISLRG